MTFFAILGMIVWALFFFQLGYALAELWEAKNKLAYVLGPIHKDIENLQALWAAQHPKGSN